MVVVTTLVVDEALIAIVVVDEALVVVVADDRALDVVVVADDVETCCGQEHSTIDDEN